MINIENNGWSLLIQVDSYTADIDNRKYEKIRSRGAILLLSFHLIRTIHKYKWFYFHSFISTEYEWIRDS